MKLFKKSAKKASLEALVKAQEKNIKECQKVIDMYSVRVYIKVS